MIEGPRELTEPAGAGSVSVRAGLSAHDVTHPMSQWMSRLADLDTSGLGAAELVDVLDGLERAKAACAAAQARVTAAFVEVQATAAERWRERAQECLDGNDFDGYCAAKDEVRRRDFTPTPLNTRPHASGSGSRRSRRGAYDRAGLAAQVGLARHESPHRGARLATMALALVHDLPHTLDALTRGELSERRAELVARLTSHLTPEQRTLVDAEVVGAHLADPGADVITGVGTWGDRRLEGAVRAVADRIDAEAAVARARTAESDRRVSIRPIPDTMALVTAVLPVTQAVALYASLTAAAATAHASGDSRSKGQVMADTLVDRVVAPTAGEGAVDSAGQAAGEALPGLPRDIPVEVQVVITDRALLDGDETPAHIPGYGPVPAGWARELLTRDLGQADHAGAGPPRSGPPGSGPPGSGPPGSAGPPAGPGWSPRARTWLRRLYTHPATGTLVEMDSRRRLFPAGLRRYLIARDGVCRTPWCDAPISHADHVTPFVEGGATSADNGQGLCVRCNQVKEQRGWRVRTVHPGPQSGVGAPHTIAITTPTGHTHISVSPPVLPGHRESARGERVGLAIVPGGPLSPFEQLLTERLAG